MKSSAHCGPQDGTTPSFTYSDTSWARPAAVAQLDISDASAENEVTRDKLKINLVNIKSPIPGSAR